MSLRRGRKRRSGGFWIEGMRDYCGRCRDCTAMLKCQCLSFAPRRWESIEAKCRDGVLPAHCLRGAPRSHSKIQSQMKKEEAL